MAHEVRHEVSPSQPRCIDTSEVRRIFKKLRIGTSVFNDATSILETCSSDLQQIYIHLERQYNNLNRIMVGLRAKANNMMYFGTQSLYTYHLELLNAVITNTEIIEETMKRVAGAIGRIGWSGNLVRRHFELPEELDEEMNQPWDPAQELEAEQATIAGLRAQEIEAEKDSK